MSKYKLYQIWDAATKWKLQLILILIAASFIRFSYLEEIKDTYLLDFNITSGTDMKGFHEWGSAIANGDWASRAKGVLFQPPLYPYFIAVIYKISGINYLHVSVVQSFIGVLLVLLIYLLSKKIFENETIALLTAFITAFYPIFIYYESLLKRTTLATFLYTLLIYSIVSLNLSKKSFTAALSGALLGIITLSEPQALALIPVIAVYLYICHREIRYPVLFSLCAILIIAPIILRNYMMGKFAFISSNGPVTWAAGNSYDSTGWFMDPQKGLIPVLSFDFFKLQIYKVFLWFSAYEIPNNTNYYQFKEHVQTLNIPFISYGILVPLAACGIIITFDYKKKLSFLYLFLITYTGITAIFMSLSRFRVPIVPVLIIFAGFTIHWLFHKIIERDMGKVLKSFAGMTALYMIFKVPAGYNMIPSYYYSNLGNLYFSNRYYSRAISEYKKAVSDKNSSIPSVYSSLGGAYMSIGRFDDAIKSWKILLEKFPDSSQVLLKNIALAYRLKKDTSTSAEFYSRYLNTLPADSPERGEIMAEIDKLNTN